jgi:hypothetical protein
MEMTESSIETVVLTKEYLLAQNLKRDDDPIFNLFDLARAEKRRRGKETGEVYNYFLATLYLPDLETHDIDSAKLHYYDSVKRAFAIDRAYRHFLDGSRKKDVEPEAIKYRLGQFRSVINKVRTSGEKMLHLVIQEEAEFFPGGYEYWASIVDHFPGQLASPAWTQSKFDTGNPVSGRLDGIVIKSHEWLTKK